MTVGKHQNRRNPILYVLKPSESIKIDVINRSAGRYRVTALIANKVTEAHSSLPNKHFIILSPSNLRTSKNERFHAAFPLIRAVNEVEKRHTIEL